MVHGGLKNTLLWMLGRRLRFRIQGESMQPAYASGDTVFVAPVPSSRLVRGDVVLVKHPFRKTHMIKRIWAKDTDGRVDVRGDNPLQSTDSRSFGALGPELVLGKVVA